ncbi:aldehyde dehydrogenase family protein [Streptomyces alboniger]|uniref:Aldehyde dehydrogenase n=1 Tax=Streptomyces alboniger TaxID=132473 RepID=A0A5J6H8X7_STRAD|nr:aldehyde dehydrogenase family protein [Streptomyces alboniger]QEV16479.1 aldehyde dehydrogenase family protein [Streptomyces alboniger]
MNTAVTPTDRSQSTEDAEDTPALVARLRATFATGRTRPLAWREEQLTRLRALFTENREAIADALHSDLRKPRAEAYAAEVDLPVREIDHTLAHLAQWLTPTSLGQESLAGLPQGSTAGTQYEPLGTVLVIAPWNYPVQLSLVPVAGALAAGNAVLLKPSELAPATSELMARLVPQYLDPEAVAVVEGGVPETTELLAQRFDHIFYTGNGTVGRIVMRAAAEHLTPVTLELGGKSPVFVDWDADVSVVAARLADTKFRNAGQTCVAPDYVLTDPATARALEVALAEAVEGMFGPDPQSSEAYGRMVNQRHFDRVSALLGSGTTVFGGHTDREDVYIAPTVLAGVKGDDPVMQEEIFGPVLPIVEVEDLDEAITFINDRDKPLALYGFTENETTRRRLAAETSSGGLGFGLPMAHLRVHDLPFGGVGESGMGSYHGPHSIAAFSHRRARLDVPLG